MQTKRENDILTRINWLTEQIMEHKFMYYLSQPEIKDNTYDLFEAELKRLDPTNPILDVVGYCDDWILFSEKLQRKFPEMFKEQLKLYNIKEE